MLGLRWKWTLVIVLCAGAPLAGLAAAFLRVQASGLALAERTLQVAAIEQAAGGLDRLLDEAAESTHLVGRVLADPLLGADEARLTLARETLARSGTLAEVALYAPDGALIDAIERKPAEGAARKPAEGAARKPAEGAALKPLLRLPLERAGWLPPEATPGGEPILRYVEVEKRAAPNGEGEGETSVRVAGAITPGLLSERLREIGRALFGAEDHLFLVAAGGKVVAAADPRRVGGTLARRELLEGAGAFAQPWALTREYRADGAELVGSVRTLPEREWALMVERPRALAYAALGRTRHTVVVLALAVLGLALAAGTWLARRTTRPVEALVELTRQYGARKFEARSPVHTGDELETLGRAMSEMADAIAAGEREIGRRAAVERDLSRFLPADVARRISESADSASGEARLALGGERRHVSALFADVTAFTKFAEEAPPERVVAFLNELFTVLTEVIFRHGGTVDKFIGDSVMALFGAPEPQDDHARRAVAAAEDMHRFVDASRSEWRERYGVDVRLGIGVHSGEALVGNLGSERRMEYTAIGDMVNVAARLEMMARPGQTLVTAETARACGPDFGFTSLGTHPLRGKRQPVEILELQ